MLRKYKLGAYAKNFLNSRHIVKKIFLANKVITEQSGEFYIVKGDPIDGVALHVTYTSMPRVIKVAEDGMIYAKFDNGKGRSDYYLPVTYNPEFAKKVYANYEPRELTYCTNNKLRIKGEPNLLAALLYNSAWRDFPLDELLDEWWKIIRWLERFEGTPRTWV